MLTEAYLLTTPDEFSITAEQERTCFLDFHGGQKRRIAHTGSFSISVRSDFRGCGIGRSLIQSLTDWVSQHPQIEKISLDVFASNMAAIHLYREMGFVQESLLKKHIKLESGEYVDIIGMARMVKQTNQCETKGG